MLLNSLLKKMLSEKQWAIFCLSNLIMGVAIAGCTPTKVAQCENFIQAASQGISLLQANQTNKVTQVTTSLQLAKDLGESAKSIENLNIQDPTLKDIQTQFVSVFNDFSKNFEKHGKALGASKNAPVDAQVGDKLKQTRTEIEAAAEALKPLAERSQQLASQLDSYCKQKEE